MGEESVWCWENTPAGKMDLLHITGLETSYGAPRYGAMSEVINLTKVVPRIFRPFRMWESAFFYGERKGETNESRRNKLTTN